MVSDDKFSAPTDEKSMLGTKSLLSLTVICSEFVNTKEQSKLQNAICLRTFLSSSLDIHSSVCKYKLVGSFK